MQFNRLLKETGMIAILRGLKPQEAIAIGERLYAVGFRLIEVPLNSPDPLESITLMRRALPADCLIGAGTVLSVAQIDAVKEAGGQLIVMPHADPKVIHHAKTQGMVCTPGVATPTEAFAAIHLGADAIKLFPAELITPSITKAWRAVIPTEIAMLPVGGITPDNMQVYLDHGASGFGLGSALYRSGMSGEEVSEQAIKFMHSWRHRRS
ncbi:2-dehydro-3-deoxy-6-phosphogalactonate aldolase [Buttiauxella warmboldiae]|uniref:2-dehydro-3-deoxy-6-phosphogalactonate aldolase n=1 Tax=Buttiauxella warmboldiae TaxID=82993 RepID=A0A3N5DGS9_9ENTR|nr:2-dehydro-3-deoxy-6-phosphogalactonate aldolase [Buttiauxella warmboldiae]RPH26491.1 2-dehydro-3-deoxy-6-phosphogalactonate aldolase [Buttiauxella warmboldiae]